MMTGEGETGDADDLGDSGKADELDIWGEM